MYYNGSESRGIALQPRVRLSYYRGFTLMLTALQVIAIRKRHWYHMHTGRTISIFTQTVDKINCGCHQFAFEIVRSLQFSRFISTLTQAVSELNRGCRMCGLEVI